MKHFEEDSDVHIAFRMKVCTRCGQEKRLLDFGIREAASDGRNPACKQCKREEAQALKIQQDMNKPAPNVRSKTALKRQAAFRAQQYIIVGGLRKPYPEYEQ